MPIEDLPADLRNRDHSARLSPYSRSVLITFFGGALLALIAWLIMGAPMPDGNASSQDQSSSNPIHPPTSEENRSHGKRHESTTEQENKGAPPENFLNGVNFYNPETPASKLTKLYTDAISKSVKDKDAKACQQGLEAFREQLNKQPKKVITDLETQNDGTTWQVPTYDTFLTPDHIKYACQQAKQLNSMSSLVPDTRTTNALAVINNDSVVILRDGSEQCYKLLSKDYKYYVQNTSIAGRVMLSTLTLTLPQELTNEQFAKLCDYTPSKKS